MFDTKRFSRSRLKKAAPANKKIGSGSTLKVAAPQHCSPEALLKGTLITRKIMH